MWLQTSMRDGRRVIALDGKSLLGARDAAGHLTHLLSALCQHTGTVLGQLPVGAKTNETPVLAKLLDTMDITGAVITADALHTQRGTADYIVSRGAHYILTVKNNQRNLRKHLKALPWKEVSVLTTDREHSHGRTATRTLKATEVAAGIGFPHAMQVLQLTRKTRRRPGARMHTEIVYAVTSLSATDAQTCLLPSAEKGPRRHLRRRPIPSPHPRRTSSHGHPEKHRPQPPAPEWTDQHSRRPTTSQPQPTPPDHTTADLLK